MKIWLIVALFTLLLVLSALGFWYQGQNTGSREVDTTTTGPVVIGIVQYLTTTSGVVDGFKEEMSKLGYTDGQNIVYRQDSIATTPTEAQALADRYVKDDLGLIFAVTSVAGRAAKKSTEDAGKTHMPIVFAHADNPEKTGLVESLVSSGNNTTGISVDLAQLTAKRLEFLKQIDPTIQTVALFSGAVSDPAEKFAEEELRRQALNLGFTVKEYVIKSEPGAAATAEIESVTNGIQVGDIDAIFQVPGPIPSSQGASKAMIALSKRLKIPFTALNIPNVEAGGLFSYSHDYVAIGRRAAPIVLEVMNGKHPSEIPITIPEKNILVLNMKTARELGFVIPDHMYLFAEVKLE